MLERLGEGGVGVVYRGRQTHLGRFVAIKVLHQDAAASPEWRRRFEREAKALSALAHPNVVPVTDFGIDHGVPFLVMELLQGKTLGDLIKEGPLPLWRALDIARQTLRGLAFAHGKGIVHRDLKPANVFLQALPDQADHVRLLDFGMAKFLEGSSSRTDGRHADARRGRVRNAGVHVPRTGEGRRRRTRRTDVYAAGVLLFELLAGRRPFVADSYEGYLGAHLTQPVPSLAKVRPGLAAASAVPAGGRAGDGEEAGGAIQGRGRDAGGAGGRHCQAARRGRHRRAREARRKPTPRALQRGAVGLALLAPRHHAGHARGGNRAGGGIPWLRHDGAKPARPRRCPRRAAQEPRRPRARAGAAQAAPPPSTPPPTAALPPPPAPTAPQPPTAAAAEARPRPRKTQAPADKPEPAEQPEQRRSSRSSGTARGSPDAGARNPWKEPVPRALRPIRDRINRGVHMSQRALRPRVRIRARESRRPAPLAPARARLRAGRLVQRLRRPVRPGLPRRFNLSRRSADARGSAQGRGAPGRRSRRRARHPRHLRRRGDSRAGESDESRAGDREATARLTRLRESLPH